MPAKKIPTPRNKQGLYCDIDFYPQADGNFVCACCSAVLPESLLDEHVQRHVAPEEIKAFSQEQMAEAMAQPAVEEPQLFTITRETPTDVMVRSMTEMDKRKVDRVLVIQVSENNTWFSSNLSHLELVGLLHQCFPKILQAIGGGEPREL